MSTPQPGRPTTRADLTEQLRASLAAIHAAAHAPEPIRSETVQYNLRIAQRVIRELGRSHNG